MLETLNKLDLTEKRGLLAQAAFSMHRDPATGEFEVPLAGRLQPLLEEATRNLEIDVNSVSERDRSRLAKLFSRELRKLILDDKTRHAARGRLADKGLLGLEAYKFRVGAHLRRQAKDFGIMIPSVRATLSKPTSFQHMTPTEAPKFSRNRFSIFVKHFGMPEHADFHWILAFAIRKKNKIIADAAWRIFRSDLGNRLDFSRASPLDLLKEFTSVFGIPIQVGRAAPSKFIVYDRIPIEGTERPSEVFGVDMLKGRKYTSNFLFRRNAEPPSIEVAIAFCIDDTKYLEALERHRIKPTG